MHHWRYYPPPQLYSLCDTVRDATVTLLLVGQSFRSGVGHTAKDQHRDHSCRDSSIGPQMEAYRSVRAHVVTPLQRCGSSVQILVTVQAMCRNLSLRALGLSFDVNTTTVQLGSWDSFGGGVKLAHAALQVRAPTDYVLCLRQDIYVSQPITVWPVTKNWSNAFLFEQECFSEPGLNETTNCACVSNNTAKLIDNVALGMPTLPCVRDHMWWAPWRLYSRIQARATQGSFVGHSMNRVAGAAMPEADIGFLFPQDYCAAFLESTPQGHPKTDKPNSSYTYHQMGQEYHSSFFHLLCYQEYAYRPMRRFSGSTSQWLWRQRT